MSRQVTIASGKSNVLLPNGATYNAGQTAVLTDVEFAKISSSLIPGTVIDNGSVVGADDQVITRGTSPTLTSAPAAGGTPTKVEFDKVVADLVALKGALTGTGKALL